MSSCSSNVDCHATEQTCRNSVCYCSPLAARAGDDCGEMTGLSYVSGILFLLLSLCSLVMFITICMIFLKFSKKIFGKKLTANTTSLMWATVVNFLQIILLITLGLRSLGVLSEVAASGLTAVLPGIMGLFFTAMFLNMSFMWVSVYQSSKTAKKSGSNVGKAKYIFIGLGLLFLLLVVIAGIVAGTEGMAAVTLLYSLLFIVSYIYGGRKLSNLLSNQSGDMKDTAKAISRTSIGVGVGLTLYDLCIVVYILGAGAKNNNVAFLGFFAAMILIVFLLRVMTKYLTRTYLASKKKLKQSKLTPTSKVAPTTAKAP